MILAISEKIIAGVGLLRGFWAEMGYDFGDFRENHCRGWLVERLLGRNGL